MGLGYLIVARDAGWRRLLAFRLKVFDYYDWDEAESPFDLSGVDKMPSTIIVRFVAGEFPAFETIRLLRDRWPRAAIVATTDSRYQEDVLDAYAAGAVVCIPEPPNINDVAELATLAEASPLTTVPLLLAVASEILARVARQERLIPPDGSKQVVSRDRLRRWTQPGLQAEDALLVKSLLLNRLLGDGDVPWDFDWAATATSLGLTSEQLLGAIERIKSAAWRWSKQRQPTEEDLKALYWAFQGLEHKEIGTKLGVEETTIRDRLRDLRLKFNSETRTRLLVVARERGYIALARQLYYSDGT